MNYLSPFTYLVSGMLSTGVANAKITCASNEYLVFNPLEGQTCGEYMNVFKQAVGGYLLDDNATESCQYCAMGETNTFIASVDIYFKDAWRNFGLMWVYIIFNVFGALFIYWLARVPKKSKQKKE